MRRSPTFQNCSAKIWLEAAYGEAREYSLSLPKLLSGERKRPYIHARWRIWRRLSQTYSYLSIARASGFDHTTVMYGVDPNRKAKVRALRKSYYAQIEMRERA